MINQINDPDQTKTALDPLKARLSDTLYVVYTSSQQCDFIAITFIYILRPIDHIHFPVRKKLAILPGRNDPMTSIAFIHITPGNGRKIDETGGNPLIQLQPITEP